MITQSQYFRFVQSRNEEAYRLGLRKGQTYFNVLHEHCPDLASAITGTPNDPFHVSDAEFDNSLNMKNFFNFIDKNLK